MPPPEPARKGRRPPQSIRLLKAPGSDGVGLLRITQGLQQQQYVFHELRCDIGGRGFAIHRLGLSPLYHVRVGRSVDCACECFGFLRHGHCKHVQGLAALIGHGIL